MRQMNTVHALPSTLIHLSVAIYALVFQMVSFKFSQKNSVYILFFLHAPFSVHRILLDYSHLNNIWGKAKIMKLLITQFSPVSCYFVLPRHKYVLKHPILK